MKQLKESYKKTGRLHHAYGLVGEREGVKDRLFDFLNKDLKFPTKANPDFWSGDFNVFKIDDSRKINESHLNKPVKYDRKIFVISANSITKDAQNALLKMFEEPSAETTFFLILPGTTNLIATLKSRMILIKVDGALKKSKLKDKTLDAFDFLEAKVGKRLSIVSKIVKDIKDEKLTKADAIDFLKNIERVIKDNLKLKNAHNGRGGSLLAVEDIEKAISYANDESPSMKVILDHLAVTL